MKKNVEVRGGIFGGVNKGEEGRKGGGSGEGEGGGKV